MLKELYNFYSAHPIIYLPNIELTILCNNMKLYILKKKVIQV